jgi:EAL domain-containing protein (putative c-di-GMP-specific phosphodiesterase class I)/FixJ family two-component response regulator
MLMPFPPASSEMRSAFVLDDEPNVGAIVCNALSAAGLKPRSFEDATPFLIQLKREHPELVVLDLALGSTDAVEVIRQLEILQYSGRVLLISGRDEATLDEINEIGLRHGLQMLPALRKPFRMSELKDRLKSEALTLQDAGAKSTGKQEKAEITVDLKEAIDKNWLELWYQPKIDLKSLVVCGAEVLIRARHPLYGLVLPVNLLPPARDPVYGPLTSAIIRRAMADWCILADKKVFTKFAINAPASVFHAPDFVNFVRKLIPRDPRFPGLIVEITEDDVIRDPAYVAEVATQLKLYNISLSIDDFGSAYASLSRLLELPCEELKLDRSFVMDCATNDLKRALCQTVVDLSHSFGLKVCAEGVENMNDLRTLITMGCDVAQGYLFAKPMPLEQLTRTLLAPMSMTGAAHEAEPAMTTPGAIAR